MERVIFEQLDAILKYFICRTKGGPSYINVSSQPYFCGLTVEFTDGYLQLLPINSSQKSMEMQNVKVQVSNVSLLDAFTCKSNLWDKVHVTRIK